MHMSNYIVGIGVRIKNSFRITKWNSTNIHLQLVFIGLYFHNFMALIFMHEGVVMEEDI